MPYFSELDLKGAWNTSHLITVNGRIVVELHIIYLFIYLFFCSSFCFGRHFRKKEIQNFYQQSTFFFIETTIYLLISINAYLIQILIYLLTAKYEKDDGLSIIFGK